ncbi:V-type ATPase [Conidiobolus coronatus NRRL 28638]|uniref:V-type proton ATPase subunit G n=1 Tax=Conidiobolus coronatus (strain ATCC 28846 / CBS 209.66 / NRRL 28638) TaxID=796925 RepID=A0A137PDX8_CONC2|nr:V-type ATPase [Conidiobolus coronatus NRRL 28638]|eukprot:KXN73141.1 V-type ATPase [Conidiobolus coronatus NRRL 28638]
MSASNSPSINTLLQSEEDASKIVAKARQYRTQRLKDARSEAAKEIEDLRKKKQSEYEAYEKQNVGTSDEVSKAIQKDTQDKVAEIEQCFNSNKDQVVQSLIDAILNVKPTPHRNAKVNTSA